jgi:hypothetical protein
MSLKVKANREMPVKTQRAEGGLTYTIRKPSLEDSLGRFTPGKIRYPLFMRLGGLRSILDFTHRDSMTGSSSP